MRRLTIPVALLAAMLATVLGASPASASCPAPPPGQSPAPCDDLGSGRGGGDVPVPLPVIDPVPTTAPATTVVTPTRPGTKVGPAVRDASTGKGATDVVGTTEGLPFTGPRTATLVVVAGVLAAVGLGSLLTGRHRARH